MAEPVLRDRVAVVTGGGRGLGAALSAGLADAGASVAVAARSEPAARAVADDIRAHGGRAAAFVCDVTDETAVLSLVAGVRERFGGVDVVVANAGVAGPTKPVQDLTMEEWRACLAVNLDGVFLTLRSFVHELVERGGGSLVAISSVTGKRPLTHRAPYAASKIGVIGLVRTMATELGPHNIRVNSICPGAIAGERVEGVIAGQADALGIGLDESRRLFVEGAALRRLVRPEEVVAACVYLASEAGATVTGEDLNVAAGLAMF